MAIPAIGLAVATVTYVCVRRRAHWLVWIAVWPFAVFAGYLIFGALLLAISLLVRAFCDQSVHEKELVAIEQQMAPVGEAVAGDVSSEFFALRRVRRAEQDKLEG